MAHVGDFLRNLANRKGLIHDEIFFALLLQLVVPSKSASLVDAKWSNVDLQTKTWTVKPGRIKRGKFYSQGTQVALLSSHAVGLLCELHLTTGMSESLFPTLGSLTKPHRTQTLGNEIQLIGPTYPVEFGEFWCLFSVVAKKNSYFTSELVDHMLEHSLGDPTAPNYPTYLYQVRHLAEWWSYALETVASPTVGIASKMTF